MDGEDGLSQKGVNRGKVDDKASGNGEEVPVAILKILRKIGIHLLMRLTLLFICGAGASHLLIMVWISWHK